MNNFKDINKLLGNIEALIPQIVGAIVALTALIGTVAGLAQNGSSVNPGNGDSGVVAPSDPKLAQETLLIPGSRDDITYDKVDYGVEVKVGDKVYTDSARNGQCYRYNGCFVERKLNSEFRKATFTAVWDENVVNNTLDEGEIKVYVNGNLNQSKIVEKGDVVNFEVPVSKIDTLKIQFPKKDGQGLSIINGVLYR
ncbi:hypothetical protein QP866_02415 [Corynebacterium imitans]|uniref:hypothetical protein n=1 Tax=Corynebacterium imitans TaxID=156978 RepID=UPI0025513BA3|nr:hypothetical protein [Corynebacterium imitans]MDK8305853.1 hypothetical protein [Corynebacterium imitans]MDK8636680.1 hypothetical protein [Corynebacterium imitans]MDK8772295.1 hypothetical protein [Corynebacterium imitans]